MNGNQDTSHKFLGLGNNNPKLVQFIKNLFVSFYLNMIYNQSEVLYLTIHFIYSANNMAFCPFISVCPPPPPSFSLSLSLLISLILSLSFRLSLSLYIYKDIETEFQNKINDNDIDGVNNNTNYEFKKKCVTS